MSNYYQTSADLDYVPTPEQEGTSFVLLPDACYPARCVEAVAKDARSGRPIIEWTFRIPAAVTGGMGEQILKHNTNTPRPNDDSNFFAYFQVAKALGLSPTQLPVAQLIANAKEKALGLNLVQKISNWTDANHEERSALRSEVARAVPWSAIPNEMIAKLKNGAAAPVTPPQAPAPQAPVAAATGNDPYSF